MSLLSFLTGSLLFASTSLIPFANALPAPAPVTVHPGTVEDIIITKNNTINATAPAGTWNAPQSAPPSYLPLSFVNYLDSNNVNAYVTGLDANGQLAFVGPDNKFYYPTTTSGVPQAIPNSAIAIPMGGKGSTTTATIPGYLSASRLWFAVGTLQFFVVGTPNGPGLVEPAAVNPNDPNAATNYGFAELTWTQYGGVFADISFVDFVGLPLGMQLTVTDNTGTQLANGLPSNAVAQVCSDLKAQSAIDGMPWYDSPEMYNLNLKSANTKMFRSNECVYTTSNELIRVLAPIDLLSQQPTAWSGYFDNYVKEVFTRYSTTPLTIDTQTGAGLVNCTSDPNAMTITCAGDNRGYAAPTAADIFGCNSGPFALQSGDNYIHYAVVPRLCAAFNRGTLLLGPNTDVLVNGYGSASGALQPGVPPSQYYTNPAVSASSSSASTSSMGGIWNYYSQAVHKHEWNGLGYAFSYDDVAALQSENVAGVVASGAPGTLTVLVGGYDLA